jgi:hypothetical protein
MVCNCLLICIATLMKLGLDELIPFIKHLPGVRLPLSLARNAQHVPLSDVELDAIRKIMTAPCMSHFIHDITFLVVLAICVCNDGGLLIVQKPKPGNFPARNRSRSTLSPSAVLQASFAANAAASSIPGSGSSDGKEQQADDIDEVAAPYVNRCSQWLEWLDIDKLKKEKESVTPNFYQNYLSRANIAAENDGRMRNHVIHSLSHYILMITPS